MPSTSGRPLGQPGADTPPPLPPRSSRRVSGAACHPPGSISPTPSSGASDSSSAVASNGPSGAPIPPPRSALRRPSQVDIENGNRLGRVSSAVKFEDWLNDSGFGQYADAFHELGVEEIGDLEHVKPTDLEAMGMRLIQVRKFAVQVNRLGIPNSLAL
mmetsp:Transcript_2149/g.6614  ORF Transcript_2149/g.6614 Transcript_2149/m.6614 type:complete len:158 (-) Transcript_2149:79-552(-)